MCGIAGFTHVAKHLPNGVLTSALESIAHRGPDCQGHFTSPQVSLGATRLRIIDLEAGDQPLKSPDGDVVLVFNGEIFNHRELRAETRMPATIAVNRPTCGVIPEAIASAIASGNATMPTVIPAIASAAKSARV